MRDARGQVMRELGSACRPHRRDRSYSAPRSVRFRIEIGRTPARDRSYSAARSVHFRTEIGPLPHRDRSHSAARSVHFRTDIGRVPVWGCGCGCLRCCTWESGVLWGGDWFLLRLLTFLVIVVCGGRVPMCVEGVRAHGSGIMVVADVAVPHDFAISADTEHAQMCNIHHPSTRSTRRATPKQ